MLPISPRQVVTLGILRDRLTIGRGIVALDDVEIMRLAEQSGVQEGELFAGRQLTRASVAREAGQMINPFPGPSHPVAGAHAASAFRALCAESSARRSGTLSVKKSCARIRKHRSKPEYREFIFALRCSQTSRLAVSISTRRVRR